MTLPVPTSRLDRFIAATAHWMISWSKTIVVLTLIATGLLAASALQTRLDPGFNKLIPLRHEYMAAFLQHSGTFSGANRVLVSVEWKGEGDIYNKGFLEALHGVTDEVFFTPGVNRGQVYSLFTPNVRYIEITEDGYVGEVLIPSRFEPNAEGLAHVRSNVAKSGQIGSLVSNDLKSAMVRADLQEIDPKTGEKLDYHQVAQRLEKIRTQFESDKVKVHIIGFSKVLGDVMDGLFTVITFFVIAFAITAVLLRLYTRSTNLTVVGLLVALLPVIWLLGLLPLIGYGIDPMSILVPFLIFSIGVSHAVQMTGAWKHDVRVGRSPQLAAENSIRKLAIPGTLALLTNALGFMVIMLIDIPIVHELGLTACLGVLLMIITNKVFLPALLAHIRLEKSAMVAPVTDAEGRNARWWRMSVLAEPRPALWTLLISMALLAVGTWGSRHLRTGDVGTGAPELRAESRYNVDNDHIIKHYSIGMDVLSVYVEAPEAGEACSNWQVMNAVDRFETHMSRVDGVRSVSSSARLAKIAAFGTNEGNPRWQTLQRTEAALRSGSKSLSPDLGLNTESCKIMNVQVFLKDHEGSTLTHVVDEAKRFIAADRTEGVRFRLAGGNAGVAAATNEAVERAEVQMLGSIFGAITILCWLTFRSWRAVLCIIVPLALVSILCNALMALLGIGLKVPTLPVIALGVGVGVDYGIYLYESLQHALRERDGVTLREAFYDAMRQRGNAAVFTALTMSIGVGTWAFSALKFQADMGILLAFMFLVNMLGAIFLLPAMACWLNVERAEARARARRPQQPAPAPAAPVGGGMLRAAEVQSPVNGKL